MMSKTLNKTLMAAGLVVALGSAGMVPAMATGAAMQGEADTSMATKASDAWITTKLKSTFATTKGIDVTDVSVDTRAGVVRLTGTVDSVAEKALAVKTARSIEGVKAVQADHLMVHADQDAMESGHDSMSSGTSMGTKASDAWITTKVKSEFAMTKGVSFGDISVDTKAGVVMLSGQVKSASEKATAIKSARSVTGVKAVEAGGLTVLKDSM